MFLVEQNLNCVPAKSRSRAFHRSFLAEPFESKNNIVTSVDARLNVAANCRGNVAVSKLEFRRVSNVSLLNRA